MRNGIERITDERNRQRERWTASHDDTLTQGELVQNAAALCCGLPPGLRPQTGEPQDLWGLVERHKANRLHQLAIAGALIAAEIERVERVILRKLQGLTWAQIDILKSPIAPITLSRKVAQELVDEELMVLLGVGDAETDSGQYIRTPIGLNAQTYLWEVERREQLLNGGGEV